MFLSVSWVIASLVGFTPSTPKNRPQPCHDQRPALPLPTPEQQKHLGGLAENQHGSASITPTAYLPRKIQRRGIDIVGWVYTPGASAASISFWCSDGYTWTTGQGVGGCCVATTSCEWFVTGCDGPSSFDQRNGVTSCQAGQICGTQSVFPYYGAGDYIPWIGCWAAADFSIYEVSPVIQAPAAPTTIIITPIAPAPSPQPVTSTVTQAPPTVVTTQTEHDTDTVTPSVIAPVTVSTVAASSTSSSGSSPTPVPKKSSTPAIVGGAVGGVAVVGILAIAGICFCLRRRRKRDESHIHAQENPALHMPATDTFAAGLPTSPSPSSQYYHAAEAKLPSSTVSSPVPFHHPSGSPSELSAAESTYQHPYSSHLPGVQELSGTGLIQQQYYQPVQPVYVSHYQGQ